MKDKETFWKDVGECSVKATRKKLDYHKECAREELLGASGNRRHQENFIAFLKRIGRSAEEANVFFVDIDIEKTADLALIIAQVRLEFGELLVEHREEFPEIGCGAGDRSDAGSMTSQSSGNIHGDGHGYAPIASTS